MYRTEFWTLWEKARVRCFERTASKHVYYQGWNRPPAQAGCMRQVLRPGALGRPRGIGWRGRWEGGLRWGIHVNPWLIHVNVWQKPLQYYKVISLQLIKINKKKFNVIEANVGSFSISKTILLSMSGCCSNLFYSPQPQFGLVSGSIISGVALWLDFALGWLQDDALPLDFVLSHVACFGQ